MSNNNSQLQTNITDLQAVLQVLQNKAAPGDAIPEISIDSNGLITATAGSKSMTQQLTTQAARTITPSTSDQTAVASKVYTTGVITVKGDSNLIAPNIAEGATIFGVTGTHGGIDTSDATAAKEEIFLNKTAYVDGEKITGSFTIDSELSEQEELLTQLEEILNTKAAGGEASPVLQRKSVQPTNSLQTIVADEGYDGLRQVTVTAMPTATQATPSITINSSGLITASANQSAVYVNAGTQSATKQLTTKAATTITPTTTSQVAVSAGTYVTGDITVAAAESSGGGTDMRFIDLLHGTITEVDDEFITSIKQYGLSYTDALKTVNLPNVTSVAPSAFRECGDLETVNLPNAIGSIGSYTFYNCSKLKTVNIPKVTNSSTGVFQNCTELERVDFGTNMATVGTSAFSGCAKLATLIIRGGRSNGTTPPNLSNVNAFTNTPIANGTGYIYVSKSLENAYKTATNWSTYANQIRAIEDYPEICG